jgi:hypothetical protein
LSGCARDRPVASDDGPIPAVARIVCDRSNTRVLTPQVRPQPDGVHLVVTNRDSIDLGFSFETANGRGGGGENADGGTTRLVLDLWPGEATVRCSDTGGGTTPPEQTLKVVDVKRLWTSPELDCDEVVWTSGGSYGKPPEGDPRDPEVIAREFFKPQPGEQVVQAGYPQAEERAFVLLREGRTIASAGYVDASFAGGEHGSGWIQHGYQACSGEWPSRDSAQRPVIGPSETPQ